MSKISTKSILKKIFKGKSDKEMTKKVKKKKVTKVKKVVKTKTKKVKKVVVKKAKKVLKKIPNKSPKIKKVSKTTETPDEPKVNNLRISKIKSIARLQEIKSGKLKELVKNNRLIIDGSHNEDGARVLNEYLQTLNCNKHVILGMMANKDHKKYISYFKDISSLTTIDIPEQPNSISGEKLKEKLKSFKNVQYKKSIEQAIESLPLKQNDLVVITGSLYLAGEMLNLN